MSQADQTYFFIADFDDGTSYSQGKDDASIDTEGKNAFYDILQRMEKVIRFSLHNGQHIYTVDLRDGHFEVDGLSFQVHDQFFVPEKKLELIYFKEVRIEVDVNQKEEVQAQRHYVNRYFIGWKTKGKRGKITQHTLAISG